jgi:amino acid adenylation domain-containing protein
MLQLHQGVSAQAERRPDATAVVWRGQRTSYGEIDTMSNRLAHLLASTGCGQGDRVAILMPKMPAAIVAMLGVLKTGAAYVPLEPTDPAMRLMRTLRAADCRWILCAGQVAETLRETLTLAALEREPLIGWLDEDRAPGAHLEPLFLPHDLAALPAGAPAYEGRGTDVAHLLFTSGSTGAPKGVMVTHEAVAHFVSWARRYFGIASEDRISQHPPLRFDVSTFDAFGALWSGAELHLVPPELNLLPHKLAQFIRDSRLTQWFSVPAVLNLMAKFDAVREADFPELKRVLFAGEVLPTPTLIHWMKRLPHARFTNLYGPTETTISSTYYTIPQIPSDPRGPIPLGAACDGEEVLVLDDHLKPVATNEIGELYIRGVGVSPGYWRDAERTRAAFLPDPAAAPGGRIYRTGDRGKRDADGILYFCGRADTQIKSRGYRIELGEIEAALNSLPELRESAVVAIDSGGFEGSLICCAYAPALGAEAWSPNDVRARLTALVPRYMVPARWLSYEALPRNANGKIDRPLLKEAFTRLELTDNVETVVVRSDALHLTRPEPAAAHLGGTHNE